tara:strand:+ start:99 stop:539 length:441 start_codon:yes stop_codon:yes gene_type:complete
VIDGEPWFVGQDVVNILLGTASGKGYIYKRLNDGEKAKVSRTILGMKPGRDTFIISESGLYKLVMRSDKAQAKEFPLNPIGLGNRSNARTPDDKGVATTDTPPAPTHMQLMPLRNPLRCSRQCPQLCLRPQRPSLLWPPTVSTEWT